MTNYKHWLLLTVFLLLSSCSSIQVKSEHSSKESEKTELSLKEAQELDNQIKEDMKALGIESEKPVEKSSKEVSPSSNVISNPAEADQKNLAFVRFNIACWNLDGDQEVVYEEDAQVQAFTDYVVVIKDKDGQEKTLPPLCLMDSTERFTNVPFSQEKIDFDCLFDNNIIAGKSFSVVQQLSSSFLWVIDPTNGQNFILTTKLCQLVRVK